MMKTESPASTTTNTSGFFISRPRYYRPHKTLLPEDFTPSPMAVLLGRGKMCLVAKGNANLKQLVKKYSKEYSQTSNKQEKSILVSRIIDMIYEHDDGGGCASITTTDGDDDDTNVHMFLKFDEHKERWWEVSTTDAREKISSLFRDSLAGEYKSSVKSKVAKRKAQRKELVRRFLEKKRSSGGGSSSPSSSSSSSSSAGAASSTPSPSLSVEMKSRQEEAYPTPLDYTTSKCLRNAIQEAFCGPVPLEQATTSYFGRLFQQQQHQQQQQREQQQQHKVMPPPASSILFGEHVEEPMVPAGLPLLMATSSYMVAQQKKQQHQQQHHQMNQQRRHNEAGNEEEEPEFWFPTSLLESVTSSGGCYSIDKDMFGTPATAPLLAAVSSAVMYDTHHHNLPTHMDKKNNMMDTTTTTPEEIGSHGGKQKRLSFSDWEASWNNSLQIYIPDPIVS